MSAPKPQTEAEWKSMIMRELAALKRRGSGVGGGGASRLMPVGACVIWPKASAQPAGTLLCDGTVYSMTDYPELGAFLGSTYGGNGTTTFAVPNYKGVTIVGQDAAQTEFDTVGETGGAKSVTLTTAQIPAHQHQERFNTSAIAPGGGSAVGGLSGAGGDSPGSPAQQFTMDAGGGGAHNNLQPYAVARFIIQA